MNTIHSIRAFALTVTLTVSFLVGWSFEFSGHAWGAPAFAPCLAPLTCGGGSRGCYCFCESDFWCEVNQCDTIYRENPRGRDLCAGLAGRRYSGCRISCQSGRQPRLPHFSRGRGVGESCGGFVNRRCAPNLYCKLPKGSTVGICVKRRRG